jgi:hypothetical protein
MFPQDVMHQVLGGRHDFADGRNVRVVPCIIINWRRMVCHPRDLVPVVLPRHDKGIFGRVELAEVTTTSR